MTTDAGLDPLWEIEYRAAWLEQNLGAPREDVCEELAGIRAAVDCERTRDSCRALAGARTSLAEARDIDSEHAIRVLTLVRVGEGDG